MEFIKFEAAMSEDELENGELIHMEMERYRRIAMVTGITKSSDDLRKIIDKDSKGYMDVLELSATAVEHYLNTIEMLLGGIERLYIVAEEFNWQESDVHAKDVLNRVARLISSNSDKLQ